MSNMRQIVSIRWPPSLGLATGQTTCCPSNAAGSSAAIPSQLGAKHNGQGEDTSRNSIIQLRTVQSQILNFNCLNSCEQSWPVPAKSLDMLASDGSPPNSCGSLSIAFPPRAFWHLLTSSWVWSILAGHEHDCRHTGNLPWRFTASCPVPIFISPKVQKYTIVTCIFIIVI